MRGMLLTLIDEAQLLGTYDVHEDTFDCTPLSHGRRIDESGGLVDRKGDVWPGGYAKEHEAPNCCSIRYVRANGFAHARLFPCSVPFASLL